MWERFFRYFDNTIMKGFYGHLLHLAAHVFLFLRNWCQKNTKMISRSAGNSKVCAKQGLGSLDNNPSDWKIVRNTALFENLFDKFVRLYVNLEKGMTLVKIFDIITHCWVASMIDITNSLLGQVEEFRCNCVIMKTKTI